MGLFCLLHSLCVSEPFAALPPLCIAELYIAFAIPISAHLCPCLSKQSARYYAVANPCFTSPLPLETMPCHRVAYPSLSIAKHSIPCRREARLFFAFARHIKSLLCRCHELHTKAFAYPALPYQTFTSLRSSKSCHRYTQQPKPLPNIAINAAAIRARHGAPPPLRFVALPCHSVAWLGLSQQFSASPLPSKPIAALLCHCFAVPIKAIPGPAIALNRALRR